MPKKISNSFKNQMLMLLIYLALGLLNACRMPAADEDSSDQQINTGSDQQTTDMQGLIDMAVISKNDIALENDISLPVKDMEFTFDMGTIADMQIIDPDMSIPFCDRFPAGITTSYEAPVAIHSEQTLAQIIRIPFDGVLSAISLPAACADGSSMNISIQPLNAEGLPDITAPHLSTTTVGNEALPIVLNSTTTVALPPFSVVTGQELAIVFRIEGGSSCAIAQTPGLDYEGGQGFYTGPISTAERWESLCPPLAQGCDLPISILLAPAGTNGICIEEAVETDNPCQPSAFPYDLNGVANTIVIGGSSHQELAQVFTAQEDYSLLALMLPIACAPGALARVELQAVTDGQPNGRILSSQITTTEQVSVPIGFPVVIQIPAVELRRGEQFAVVLKIDQGRSTMDEASCALKPLSASVIDQSEGYYKGLPNPLTQWNPLCQLPSDICDLPIFLSTAPLGTISCPAVQGLNIIPPPTIEVDPSIQLGEGDGLNRLEGANGEQRKLAGVTDDRVLITRFVEAEVILNIDQPNTLEQFLNRYPSTVISETNFSDIDLSKLDSSLVEQGFEAGLRLMIQGLGKQIHLKIDENQPAVIIDQLSQHLRLIDPISRGSLYLSSEQGLKTLALVAQAKVEGFDIAINWLVEHNGIRQRQTVEAMSNAHGRSNGFEWDILSRGGIFNTGIADSWRALFLEDRLVPNRIGVGIIDGGFAGTHIDYPSQMTFVSNIPLVDDIRNRPNGGTCGGGSICAWHGTGSALSAFGQVDNGYGGAGPAGPVANGIVTASAIDLASAIPAVIKTIGQGARVVNMSFGARIPASLSFVVIPFERLTSALSQSILFIASAGNENTNVDEEDCFGICWERAFISPCENDGVYCVGATAMTGLTKASYSNYGNHRDNASVDLYAPGDILVGMRRMGGDLLPLAMGDNYAEYFSGTSAASPFAAGSLALLWTIQPSLSARVLMREAMPYFVDGTDGNVVNFIQIYDAVIGFLGYVPNEPPQILEISSSAGLNVPLNVANSFVAITSDLEDAISCCNVVFRSNLEGVIGTGRSISHAFQVVGTHQITAIANDSQGRLSDPYVFEITVVNQAPSIEILRPVQGYTSYQNIGFRVTVRASDLNELSPFSCDRIQWQIESAELGERVERLEVGADCSANVFLNKLGARALVFETTDLQGLVGRASLSVNVIQRPSNLPPRGQIDLPLDGAHFNYPNEPIRITGTAIDPEGDPLYITWFASWGAGIGIGGPVLAVDELSFDWTPSNDGFDCSLGIFIPIRVDLVISDGNSVVEADQVSFFMDCPPM